MKKQILAVLVSATLLGVVGPAEAEPIIDTGHLQNDPNNCEPCGWQLSSFQSFAAEFTTTKQYFVRSLEGWLRVHTGGALRLSLFADGGEIPGERLFTTVVNLEEAAEQWRGATNLSWSIAPSTYWVAFEGTRDEFLGDIFMGQNPLLNEALISPFDPGLWQPLSTLDISVRILGDPTSAPIPEPGTILLLSAATAIGVMRGRLRANP